MNSNQVNDPKLIAPTITQNDILKDSGETKTFKYEDAFSRSLGWLR